MTNRLIFVYIKDLYGFSPFSINFSNDYDISLDGYELTILQKTNRFKSLLGDNISDINIIAGENGIGKTTLLRKLAELISFPEDDNHAENYEYLMVYQIDENRIRVINLLEKQVDRKGDKRLLAMIDEDFKNESRTPPKSIIYYSPFLDFNLLDVHTRDKDYPVVDISQTNILLQDTEDNEDQHETQHDLFAHKIRNMTRQLIMVKNKRKMVEIPFEVPKNVDIKFNRLNFNAEDIPIRGKSIFDHLNDKCAEHLRAYPESKLSEVTYSKLVFLRNLLSLYFLAVTSDKSQQALRDRYIRSIIEEITTFNDPDPEKLIRLVKKFFKLETHFGAPIYNELIKVVLKALETKSNHVHIDRSTDQARLRVSLSAPIINSLLTMLASRPNSHLYHKFTTNHLFKFISLEWSNLSSGEKGFLDIFSRLLMAKDQMIKGDDTIFIMLDEGEVGFHPSWQMNYIWYLREFLSKAFKGYNLQILLATHSPLVLSDLPKERVHLFKKFKVEKRFVSGKMETFGTLAQNVSVLLTQDFFINNTLIGTMARRYIDDIITRIHSVNKKQLEPYANIAADIEQIDEPVIKKLLLNELKRRENA
nr:AAA family ATPase [uncultured Mucilaginibacter sp.]